MAKKKSNTDGVYGLDEKKCAVCGKVFIPAPLHVYKRHYSNLIKWFCSYHCLFAWDKTHTRRYVNM